eukprot:1159414-Pelagomonas_calceolata.AAC.3
MHRLLRTCPRSSLREVVRQANGVSESLWYICTQEEYPAGMSTGVLHRILAARNTARQSKGASILCCTPAHADRAMCKSNSLWRIQTKKQGSMVQTACATLQDHGSLKEALQFRLFCVTGTESYN